MIVFPRKAGKVKKGDSQPEVTSAATQLKTPLFPVVTPAPTDVSRKITSQPTLQAYATLRKARSDKKLKGIRDAKAKAEAEEAAAAKK